LPTIPIRILACTVTLLSSSTYAQVRVWTIGSLDRVDPIRSSGSSQAVRLSAARNEYEAFQLAVRTDGQPVTIRDIRVTDLATEGGQKIAASNITRYREHLVYVRRPSPKSPAPPGLYPDALIPFVSPIDGAVPTVWSETNKKGAKYTAVPQAISPGFTETFWIEVYVPSNTAPGDYRGEIRILFLGSPPVSIPLSLHVWGLTLPDVPTVRSHFGGMHRVAASHGVKPSSPEFRAIEERYLAAMADHRITPAVPSYLLPVGRPDGSIDTSKSHAGLAEFIRRYRVNAIQVPLGFVGDPTGKDRDIAAKHLAAMQAYLAEHGWLDGAYVYILDEPNTKEAYEEVRRRASLVHQAAPKLRVLCTEQTRSSTSNWGDLNGAVDIWVPLWPLHDEPTAQQRLAKGDRLWSYTALCQQGEKYLFWQLDYPPLNYRVWAWINFRYQITGLLYWTAVYWGHVKDPWLDQPSFRLAYNGEGMLVYPGNDAGFDGPVVSMRLKQIREGMEDYEYLNLLARKAGQDKAIAFARRVGESWCQWERDPERMMAVRTELANAILEAKVP